MLGIIVFCLLLDSFFHSSFQFTSHSGKIDHFFLGFRNFCVFVVLDNDFSPCGLSKHILEKTFVECIVQDVEPQATRKSNRLVGNLYRSVNIASIFDFIILSICLSADET